VCANQVNVARELWVAYRQSSVFPHHSLGLNCGVNMMSNRGRNTVLNSVSSAEYRKKCEPMAWEQRRSSRIAAGKSGYVLLEVRKGVSCRHCKKHLVYFPLITK